MKVSHRVYNSRGNLVGFLVDNSMGNTFINTGTAMKFIDSIDNLSLCDTGEFQYTGNKLVDITLKQYNESQYKVICKNNPITRDIQSDFEYWRTHESDKILQVLGPPGVGKTSELLKFAYKHYEQIISLYLPGKDRIFNSILSGLREEKYRFLESLLTGNITLDNLNKYLLKYSDLPKYMDDRSTILVLDIEPKQLINIDKLRNLFNCDIVIVSNDYLGNSDKLKEVTINTLLFKEFYKVTTGKNSPEFLKLLESQLKQYDGLVGVYRQIGGYPQVVMQYLETKSVLLCSDDMCIVMNYFRDIILNNSSSIKYLHDIDKQYKLIAKALRDDEYLRVLDTKLREVISILSYYKIIHLKCSNTDEYKVYFTDCGVLSYILRNNNYSKADTDRIILKAFKQN